MPKISVILPVYNGENYLKKSLESILGQTYPDFELIIVDDCSMDDSSQISLEYAKSDSRIRYVRNELNLKLPESLNRGFAHAKGEYWTWTSCDNVYLPTAFENMLLEIESSNQIGLVYAGMEIINEEGKSIGSLEAGSADDLILRNVVGACFLYRSHIGKEVGSYDKEMFLCEDYDYWLRLASIALIKPLSSCLYQYRRHPKSLSSKHEQKIIDIGIRLQKKYYPVFIKNNKQAARFYAHLRDRDIYNPFRQFYLLKVLSYSPSVFACEIWGLIQRRFK